MGSRTKIKICGITTLEDALMALEAGADALGFNGWPRSKRYLEFGAARDWIASLPAGPLRVAVLVNPGEERLREVVGFGCFDMVQLHGEETREFCAWARGLGVGVLRGFRMEAWGSGFDPAAQGSEDLLLDGPAGGGYGGAGLVADWAGARRLVEGYPAFRFWLAGGLNPGNVGEAIDRVRPHGVDVASGVEIGPGRKDIGLVQRFVRAAGRVA